MDKELESKYSLPTNVQNALFSYEHRWIQRNRQREGEINLPKQKGRTRFSRKNTLLCIGFWALCLAGGSAISRKIQLEKIESTSIAGALYALVFFLLAKFITAKVKSKKKEKINIFRNGVEKMRNIISHKS